MITVLKASYILQEMTRTRHAYQLKNVNKENKNKVIKLDRKWFYSGIFHIFNSFSVAFVQLIKLLYFTLQPQSSPQYFLSLHYQIVISLLFNWHRCWMYSISIRHKGKWNIQKSSKHSTVLSRCMVFPKRTTVMQWTQMNWLQLWCVQTCWQPN